MRIFSTLLFIAQGLLLSQAAYGQATLPPAVLLDSPGQVSLNGHIEYLEDKEGNLTLEEAAASGNFVNAGENAPNFGFTKSVYWFRFSITNQTKQQSLILEQGYTHIDYISLFTPSLGGGFIEQQSGDMLPFKKRAREYRTITFNLEIEPGDSQLVYVRTQTSSSTQLPLKTYTESTFSKVSEREGTALGAYYGIILVMIVFNALLWMSLRDKTYLSYVAYLAFYLVFQLTLNGNGLRYLFTESPSLNSIALPFSMFMVASFIYRFTREFMDLEQLLPKASRAFVWAERIFIVAAIASIWLPYSIMIKPAVLISAITPLILLAIGVACVRQGYRPARTFLTAWSIFLLGMVIYALKSAGILPSNTFTEFAIQVGSALEVTLLSLALADRFKAIQTSSLESERQLVLQTIARSDAEKKLNQSLSARLFLLSDLAHRVNNPLNVAQGGAQVGRDVSQGLIAKVFSFFPEPANQSPEEMIVVKDIEEMAKKINGGFEDANVSLNKAVRYIKDLSVIGGVNGCNAKMTLLQSVVEECKVRIEADLGVDTRRFVVKDSLLSLKVIGEPALLAVGLSAWIKHSLLRTQVGDEVVMGGVEDAANGFIELELRRMSGHTFESEFHENISAKEIVMGLLGEQGAQWQEDSDEAGQIARIGLRLPATEQAWLQAQGAENRK
jgi:signal transduction histidine kinase